MSRTPVRTCVSCRRARPRDELVRVVKAPDGAVSIDEQATGPGRGAYICRDTACIRSAIADDARRLRRALRASRVHPAVEALDGLHDHLKTASAS